MTLEKPRLFPERRDFMRFAAVMLLLVGVRLSFMYRAYQIFIAKPFYYTTASVLNTYPKTKNGKTYTILKLESREGLTFFTTSYRKRDLHHREVRIQLYPNERITFWEYLGSFYIKSRIKEVYSSPSTVKTRLMRRVAAQHSDPMADAFYQAIFFAAPPPKVLREKISALGVSHLVALSGFHLGILWSVIYSALLLLYRPFQKRYFPYRFSLVDVGVVTILCLGLYVWFVGLPPSLVRSYAMVLVGWVVMLLGLELLSFTFLATVGLTLLALFPALLVSLGFWLSVVGVFYIFLLLQYTKGVSAWVISLLVIPLGIFVLMLPVVHTVFALTTPYQLLSPLLSVLFIPFYPLVILLHLLGVGALLDSALLGLFRLPHGSSASLLPLWMAAGYLLLSLWAVWSRKIFYLLLGTALCYTAYLFY